ncbi:hypothetical protein JCM17380_10200 [Desulfosporosinus burensis]
MEETAPQVLLVPTYSCNLACPYCYQNGIKLRVVLDKSNFEELVTLAEDLESRGWLDLPPQRFKTQVGRNYELFECSATPGHLLGHAEHWATFAKLAEKYPLLKKFHKPEFKGINHLVQTGELTYPLTTLAQLVKLNGSLISTAIFMAVRQLLGKKNLNLGLISQCFNSKPRKLKNGRNAVF